MYEYTWPYPPTLTPQRSSAYIIVYLIPAEVLLISVDFPSSSISKGMYINVCIYIYVFCHIYSHIHIYIYFSRFCSKFRERFRILWAPLLASRHYAGSLHIIHSDWDSIKFWLDRPLCCTHCHAAPNRVSVSNHSGLLEKRERESERGKTK